MTTEVSELITRYNRLSAEKRSVAESMSAVRRVLSDLSPVKKGDVVTAKGFVHIGKKLSVTHITFKFSGEYIPHVSERGPGWLLAGNIIKKNGVPGLVKAYSWVGMEEASDGTS